MKANANILILDDEEGIRHEISEFLTANNYSVYGAERPSEAFRILGENPVDIALIDIRLPEMSGLDFLAEMIKLYPEVQAIVISGHGDMDSVIQSLRMGAVDYLKKPFSLENLLISVEKARKYMIKAALTETEDKDMGVDFGASGKPYMVVESLLFRSVMEKIQLLARAADTVVLITGESGTGKELVAREIHYRSCRRKHPFLAVNCSSIPEELFESEFFGYRKGSFTGAIADKPGWFESANKGTLLLDEIGDMKPGLQAKLLRVMEEKKITRLGSTASHNIDVRVIASTNQDLGALSLKGQFRKDLLYRINSFVIEVPPLRWRLEAVPPLFSYFLTHFAEKMKVKVPEVQPGILKALAKYDFPGNIRELKHMVERAVILADGGNLTLQHFEHLSEKTVHLLLPDNHQQNTPLDKMERDAIIMALQQSRGNKSAAARLLNISRQAIDRRIEKFGL